VNWKAEPLGGLVLNYNFGSDHFYGVLAVVEIVEESLETVLVAASVGKR